MWDNLLNELTPKMLALIGQSTLETLYMGFGSAFLAVVFGVPLGFIVFITGKKQILENLALHRFLNIVINIGRSIPFIILLVILLPVTRFIVGTTLGTTAAIVPLSVGAMPFLARITANALQEIPTGLTEAAKSMGASNWQIISKFYLPESLPILINGITLSFVTLIGYTAMAGIVGGGGLGQVAINYGEYRNMIYVKWAATIIIILIVILSQKLGDKIVQTLDKR